MTTEQVNDELLKEKAGKWAKHVLDVYTTHMLSIRFQHHFESLGYKKMRGGNRLKNIEKVYLTDGASTRWNRCENYIWNGTNHEHGEHDLEITMRVQSGWYIIIGTKDGRALEYDFRGLIGWIPELFRGILKEHAALFNKMGWDDEQ
jgi:hypothetical protein